MRKNTLMTSLVCFVLAISFSAFGALNSPASEYDEKMAEDAFIKYCTGCHSADRSLRTLKDEVNWKFAIERMAFQYKLLYGEPIPPKTLSIILEYLVRNAGKQ